MTPADHARYDFLKQILRRNQGRDITLEQKQELAVLSKQLRDEDAARFGDGLTWCSKLLYEHDPIGIGDGMPPDEYEIEARMVLKRLADAKNPTYRHVQDIVHGVFVEMFASCAGDRSDYSQLAEELLCNNDTWMGK